MFHDKITLALQNEGLTREAREKRDARMGKLTKKSYKELAANLAKQFYISLYKKEYKDIEGGLDSDMNCGKLDFLKAVLFKRNHIKVSCCSFEFYQFAHDGKVFFMLKANGIKLVGLDMVILIFIIGLF